MNCVRWALRDGAVMTKAQIVEASGKSLRTVEGLISKWRAAGAVVCVGASPPVPGACGQPEKLFKLNPDYVWPELKHPKAAKPAEQRYRAKPHQPVKNSAADRDVLPVRRRAPSGLEAAAIASRTDLELAWSMR